MQGLLGPESLEEPAKFPAAPRVAGQVDHLVGLLHVVVPLVLLPVEGRVHVDDADRTVGGSGGGRTGNRCDHPPDGNEAGGIATLAAPAGVVQW